jgi:hypothetical protein
MRSIQRAGVALVAVAALVGSVAIAPPAAAQTVVVSNNFDDGTVQGWWPSAGTLTASTAAAHSPRYSLLSQNRPNQWDGPNRGVTGILRACVKYSYSLFVRMAPSAGTANLHLTGYTGTTPPQWRWLTNNPLVTENAWVELSGTSIGRVGLDSIYVESQNGQLGSFFIDDVTITQLPPSMPVITSPAEGQVTGSPVTISGTGADPCVSSTLKVYDRNGGLVCTAVVAENGTWSCPNVSLPPGRHDLWPKATDGAGVSTPGYPVKFFIDETAPPAPVITSPVNQAVLAASPPVIAGTGEPSDTVTVTDGGGATVCTATVDGNGNWACQPTQALADGSHTLTPTAADLAGNTTVGSPITIAIDTTAPATPTITSPTNGTVVNSTPTISGTGEVGTTVTVVANAIPICADPVSADGTWSCAPDTPLADGTVRLVPTDRDSAGNMSAGPDIVVNVDSALSVASVVKPATEPVSGR